MRVRQRTGVGVGKDDSGGGGLTPGHHGDRGGNADRARNVAVRSHQLLVVEPVLRRHEATAVVPLLTLGLHKHCGMAENIKLHKTRMQTLAWPATFHMKPPVA